MPWTTSHVQGSPEPPAPFRVQRIFPKLQFKDPVDICVAPGTGRICVALQAGQVYSFETRAETSFPELFLDLARVAPGLNALYGITFHPGFQTNRYVYVCYVLKDGLPNGSRVSRFTVDGSSPPRVDPATESVIITWTSGGHNGGCIKFGLDGFLYISTGDAAGPDPADPLRTGQDTSDLLSSILRIDVDHTTDGRAYRVPPDNPFAGSGDSRPEVWAYGLRNPWRMSFDRRTGALWVADVGWELWEMVYRVERGGNYGWSIVEGPQSVHPGWKRGPSPILPPVKAHPHTEAASITGGCVYYGQKFSELAGAYIYGDWVTGKIWALRPSPAQAASVQELVDTPLQIVCFGEADSGELLILDYGGGIYELERNSASATGSAFPRALSETGLFTSTKDHELAPGVVRFEVNAEMWSDYARADRFIGLPAQSRIQTGPPNVWMSQGKNDWRYPSNAVLGKTLSLETERGNPQTRHRLETQVLHFDGLDWHAYTYRWNDAQTDAALVGADGGEAAFKIQDASAPDGSIQQAWRFHSRAECLRCHNPWVNVALAFTAPQLNREIPAGLALAATGWADAAARLSGNQLRVLSGLGLFDQALDERARPALTDPCDGRASLHERARSWLHVNCSHCHREGAGGSVPTHFDYDTALADMKAIDVLPSQGGLGLQQARVISPGDPCSSVLYYRVATSGQGHMPLIGSRLVDTRGMLILHDWIGQLPAPAGRNESANPAADRGRNDRDLQILWDPGSSRPEVAAALDRLLSSPNAALSLLSAINTSSGKHALPAAALEKVAAHPMFQVRDLFERFLPEGMRPHKLGQNIKPEEILVLRGDAERGKAVFTREGSQCVQCHRMEGQGREFGPDLREAVRKYPRAQLLEQILQPSKFIDPAYVTYQLETKDERSYAGFVLKRTEEEVLLKDSTLAEVRVPTAQIRSIQPQQLSVMPEGLLQSMTAEEAADLLEYLVSAGASP